MQTGKILNSLDKIESTIRDFKIVDLETANKIIRTEIMNIQKFTNDNKVMQSVFEIYYNWKVFSGQIENESFKSGRPKELENIFRDCSNIRTYITRI